MGKAEKFRKYRNTGPKDKIRLQKSMPMSGRDIVRREAQFRIAPKHPGMGRR